MTTRLTRLALILILVSLSCSIPISVTPTAQPTPRAVSQLYVTAGADATPTPTPFQPVGPTLTPTVTNTPVPSATPEPEIAESEAEPTPIRMDQPMPEGTVNLLVLGSDKREDAGFRTDVMMLVSIHGSGKVNVVSFPRDLYVTIPGWTTQRLNTAFAYGGFQTMADTFEYNFGVRPTYYVMTNFQGFIDIIDSLAGVTVNADSPLKDKCDLPQARGGYCTVDVGPVVMDGATALWYVRSRYSSSDFDRTRRAQEVLFGLFQRFMSIDAITQLPDFYSYYQNNVETNMDLDVMASLLPVAANIINDPSNINRYVIGPGYVTPFTTSGGAMVLLPNYDAIYGVIAEAVYGE
jgi:LCP family protein required for cell wall assembly